MHSEINRLVDDFERGRLSRRALVAHLGGMVAALTAGAALAQDRRALNRTDDADEGADGPEPLAEPTFTATRLDHIALTVTDIPRSRDWYMKHLGLSMMRESRTSCFLRCGDDFVALFRGERPGLHHYSYAIPRYDAADAVERLRAADLEPRRQGNRVYFNDPDDLIVQVAHG